MNRSILSSDADVRLVRRRGTAAWVVAAWLGAAGVAGAADAPAGSPTTNAGNPPASRSEQSAAPTTAKAYFNLALQEAGRISDPNDQPGVYGNILLAQLAAGDIAAAQQILPRINDDQRSFLEGQIAVQTVAATAAQGNFADARDLVDRIEVESARRMGEKALTQAQALDLVKKGKADEALQVAQDQDEPIARMTVLCLLVRTFALDKDAQRAKKALDLAVDAASHLDPNESDNTSRYLAESQATVGDVEGARARADAIAHPPSRDLTYGFVAAAQVRTGDVEGASQTMECVGQSGGGRATGYGLCANASLERKDETNARRFVQQAIAAYSADPDTLRRSSALSHIVGAQARLGETAEALALTRSESNATFRAMAYHTVALLQTLRDGPAAAHTWAQGLQPPTERAHAYLGIAKGLSERQKRADSAEKES